MHSNMHISVSYIELLHVSVPAHRPQGARDNKSETDRHGRATVVMALHSVVGYVVNISVA
jgi:hypothetical protein